MYEWWKGQNVEATVAYSAYETANNIATGEIRYKNKDTRIPARESKQIYSNIKENQSG
jgi:hypothetical protein